MQSVSEVKGLFQMKEAARDSLDSTFQLRENGFGHGHSRNGVSTSGESGITGKAFKVEVSFMVAI